MIAQLEQDLGRKIYTGEFGADMKVFLINDGPVTIVIDTKTRVIVPWAKAQNIFPPLPWPQGPVAM